MNLGLISAKGIIILLEGSTYINVSQNCTRHPAKGTERRHSED